MTRDAGVIEGCSGWAAACAVQRRFMQPVGPAMEALDYSARCRQVEALGGDFFDFQPRAEDGLAVAAGDASGKGVAAALMISNVQSSLRTAALFTGGNVAAAAAAVNRQVYGSSLADRYATLFYGAFERASRTLRYVNAGHHPPMVLRRDGSIDWLETGGAPVGMFPDWPYEEGTVRLDPGDLVFAYTDGVVEAMNPDGEEWGVEGFRRAAEGGAGTAAERVEAIFQSLDEFTRGCQTDDATVVVLQVR